MNFDLTPSQRAWQQECARFVTEMLQPHDAEIERSGEIPASALAGLSSMGMFGLNTPVEYGGRGLPMLETCLALRELAKAHIAYYYISGVNLHIGSKGIEFGGTEEQRRRWLPELASGRLIAAFALTEPGAGSDATGIATAAVRDGDGYVLNGRKIYITNAPVADVMTVFARTSDVEGAGGVSAFIVEAGTPGLKIGPAQEMLAGNGSTHAEVIFEDCRVPADNLLGRNEGQGFGTAMRCLDAGRVCWASYCVGAGERLLALALDHTANRRQFGRPLAANQGVAWQLADMQASLHGARLVADEAAWVYDNDPRRRTGRSALSKLIGADMVFGIADRTLQLFGGAGYSRSSPVERIWREVRVVRILDGTSEIMRSIVARELLAEPNAPAQRHDLGAPQG